MTSATLTPDRPAGPDRPRDRQVSQFTELSRRVQETGLMRRRYGYYWTRLVLAALTLPAIVVGFVWIGDSWWQMFLAAGIGVVMTQIAFIGHDAAHRQIFGSGRWNDWVSLVVANLFVGLSYGWWQHKHTRHHANPNKDGSDPDIDLPVLSQTAAQADRRRNPWTAWLMARQGWFFFPLLLVEGLDLHLSGLRRVCSKEPVRRRWVEIAFLAIRLGGYLAMVLLVLPPGKAALFLAIQLGVFGLYMGGSFAPNHKGMPLVPADVRIDFLRRQTLMSRNVSGGRWVDVFMGGLNFQVEHHLFPSMPRPSLRKVQPIVRAYCAEVGVVYTEASLWRSYGIVIRYLNRVGLGVRDTFACPLVAQYR